MQEARLYCKALLDMRIAAVIFQKNGSSICCYDGGGEAQKRNSCRQPECMLQLCQSCSLKKLLGQFLEPCSFLEQAWEPDCIYQNNAIMCTEVDSCVANAEDSQCRT